ncbi:hypothetical protein C2G38_2156165 [Gigaspora rosea]|uniref:Uncharacterized protein n=1 Tax=Gigaspora rosea TaxID=44941 RepID=A0A397W2Y3_9GLOM|nr:hypothetical protein C2G38_2156165 [Gigaspora rosea]
MSTDIEDNDLYTFEFTRIITEIENEITINDPTDDDTEDEFEDEIDEESESEADESENETTNSKNKKKGEETNITPHSIFHLFFTDLQLNTIVENTNYYAVAKSAGKGREWASLTKSLYKSNEESDWLFDQTKQSKYFIASIYGGACWAIWTFGHIKNNMDKYEHSNLWTWTYRFGHSPNFLKNMVIYQVPTLIVLELS